VETHIRSAKPDLAHTPTVADWANQNRQKLVLAVSALLVLILVVVGSVLIYNARSASAQQQFDAAMRTYESPVASQGQPLPPGTKSFPSDAAKAKQAYGEFAVVADKYGMTSAGRNAKYMAGVTAAESGQPATAEKTLKEVASGWNGDTGSLANLALAHLYRQSGRDADAIEIYKHLSEKPTTVVPAGLAQMQLADLYEAENKPAEAKKIYAQLKDKDAKSAAGEMAAQKLTGAPVQ